MEPSCIGIDIVEISRVRRAVLRWGERFLRRVYTPTELEHYRDRVESLAARFAGKEAAWKALGPPPGFFSWQDVEILNEEGGRPRVNLYGNALQRARALGLGRLDISLSHTGHNAVAVVIGIPDPDKPEPNSKLKTQKSKP